MGRTEIAEINPDDIITETPDGPLAVNGLKYCYENGM